MDSPLIRISTQRRESEQGRKNLIGILEPYMDAVRNQGRLPILIPIGLVERKLRELCEHLDGIMLSGVVMSIQGFMAAKLRIRSRTWITIVTGWKHL